MIDRDAMRRVAERLRGAVPDMSAIPDWAEDAGLELEVYERVIASIASDAAGALGLDANGPMTEKDRAFLAAATQAFLLGFELAREGGAVLSPEDDPEQATTSLASMPSLDNVLDHNPEDDRPEADEDK
jgi:hypothetical protein